MIIIKNETELISQSVELVHHAREMRFWDNYASINKKEYGKMRMNQHLKKLDELFKKFKMNNKQRLNAIRIIIQSDKL